MVGRLFSRYLNGNMAKPAALAPCQRKALTGMETTMPGHREIACLLFDTILPQPYKSEFGRHRFWHGGYTNDYGNPAQRLHWQERLHWPSGPSREGERIILCIGIVGHAQSKDILRTKLLFALKFSFASSGKGIAQLCSPSLQDCISG